MDDEQSKSLVDINLSKAAERKPKACVAADGNIETCEMGRDDSLSTARHNTGRRMVHGDALPCEGHFKPWTLVYLGRC